jgi:DNA polymerase III gamma/tau subunit
MVEEVRERVIRASAYRPFEGGSRVFVLEAAEAMRDESQNALLKTLEEPP